MILNLLLMTLIIFPGSAQSGDKMVDSFSDETFQEISSHHGISEQALEESRLLWLLIDCRSGS